MPLDTDTDVDMTGTEPEPQKISGFSQAAAERFTLAAKSWINRNGQGISLSDKVNRMVQWQKCGAELHPHLKPGDPLHDRVADSQVEGAQLPGRLVAACPKDEAGAKAFLEEAMGPYSSCNRDQPGTSEKLSLAMTQLPDLTPVQQSAIQHVIDRNVQHAAIQPHLQAAQNGTFQKLPALQSVEASINAGNYEPMGDLLNTLMQHNQAMASEVAKDLVDSKILHNQANTQVVPLQKLTRLALLLPNEQDKQTLTNAVMNQAVLLRDQARTNNDEATAKKAETLVLQSVGRLAMTSQGIANTDVPHAFDAAQKALQNGSHTAVLNMVGDLARSGHPTALELAGQVVKSPAFKNIKPEEDVANSMLTVAEAQTLRLGQSNASAFSPGGNVSDQEIHDASVFLINRTAGAGVADLNDPAGIPTALRGVELLSKRGHTDVATKLATGVFNQQVAEIKAAGSAAVRPGAGPRPNKDRNDDSMDLIAASEADELLQMAEVLQSIKALNIAMPGPTTQLLQQGRDKFVEAMNKGQWEDATKISYLPLTVLASKDPGTKGILNDDPDRETKMANAHVARFKDANAERLKYAREMMTCAETKLKTLSATDLEGDGPFDFLEAMDTSLGIAAKDRDSQTEMCNRARSLRSQVAAKLGLTLPPGNLDHERANLENAAIANAKVGPLVAQMNDRIDLSASTSSELNSISSHLNTKLRHNVNRYEGEMKTGLDQARAFCYSSGSNITTGDADRVQAFALQSALAVDQACKELVKGDFQKWDTKGTYLQLLGRQQEHWANSATELTKIAPTLDPGSHNVARKAMGYDLRKMDSFIKGKSDGKADDYAKVLKVEWNGCLETAKLKFASPSSVDMNALNVTTAKDYQLKKAEESFMTKRAAVHASQPQSNDTKVAAEKAVKMLSARAGYLIEERMYQLLPEAQHAGWDAQNTALINGTRPDIVLPLSGDKFVCLDATASKSGGHIFNKTNAWHDEQVTMAIEITYPSFDSQSLESLLLDKVTVDLDKMKADQKLAAEQEKKEHSNNLSSKDAARDAWRDTAKFYKSTYKAPSRDLFNDLKAAGATKEDMAQLSTWSGLATNSTKAMVIKLEGTIEEFDLAAVNRALKALDQVVKDEGVKLKNDGKALEFLATNGAEKGKDLPDGLGKQSLRATLATSKSKSTSSSLSASLPAVDGDGNTIMSPSKTTKSSKSTSIKG